MTLEVGLVTLEAGLVALWRRGLWHCGGGACDTAEAGLVALEAGLVTGHCHLKFPCGFSIIVSCILRK